MDFPLSGTGLLLALSCAVFTVGSVYAMGRLLLASLGQDRYGHHVPFGIGFGVNHLLFLAASLFLDGPDVVLLMNLTHAAIAGFSLLLMLRRGITLRRPDSFWPAMILVLLLPYLFRSSSPPMNVDGLNFYLPNIEWVYHRGLAFNPHLTAYTTMPMAAEYLFAQSYGLAGIPGVVYTDVLFGILVLRIAYGTARMILTPAWAWVFLLFVLLMPHSLTYLFGSCKVDMLLVYLVLSAGSMLLQRFDPPRVALILFLFLVSCAVKYPVWLQVMLPIATGMLYLLYRREWRLLSLACILSCLLVGPVMLKNKLQVGNPLAPLVYSPKQNKFVASSHVPLGWDKVKSVVKKSDVKGGKPIHSIANVLEYTMAYILYAAFGMLLVIAYLSRLDLRRVHPVLAFLLLSLLPLHLWLYENPQPPRFMLFSLMMLVMVMSYMAQGIVERIAGPAAFHVGLALASILLLANLLNSYGKHSQNISQYHDAGPKGLGDWYAAAGKPHYAISRRMFDDGWLDRKVMYLSPMVIGTVPFSEIGKVHKDLDIFLNRRSFQKRLPDYDYIFCTMADRQRFGLLDSEVVYDYGYHVLLKR